ncbi:cytochrome P450 [Massariosphaeria phaeospora]|uniref:Cytochrome P450 n=1 Tax=Massariosphaeria phaeospora TaxID=100035 RepID=A0A7C8MIH7_9PLEO|nr:cytochrome P450 [Massariosphaeria phaeospora]
MFYYLYELALTRAITKKSYQLVGSPVQLLPKSILNLIYAFRCSHVMKTGLSQNPTKPFQVIRDDGSILVLPPDLLEELSSIPGQIASPNEALEHDLLGPYTGLNLIIESRLHHSIVQRKLTPRLSLLTPELEKELVSAVEDIIPSCDDWTEVKMYQLLGKVSARMAARALVGPSLCRNKVWLDISVNYTEDHFYTIVILRLFPGWMRPVLCYLLPFYWKGKYHMRKAKNLLGPKLTELIRQNDAGQWSPDNKKKEDAHVLAWMIDTAKGDDRNVDTLAHLEVLLALASVYTTLLRMVNVLYDLTAKPEYFALLEQEIKTEAKNGWSPSSYANLHKLDSVLRESQRISPPTTLGMKRKFKTNYTFANGLHIPKDSYVCMPTHQSCQ